MNVLAEVALAQAGFTPIEATLDRQPSADSSTMNKLGSLLPSSGKADSAADLGEHGKMTKLMGETPKRERVYRFGEVGSSIFSSPVR